MMEVVRTKITLPVKSRGMHLVTGEIVKALPELAAAKIGLLHLFLQHTSAALAVNENADPDVRRDLAMALDHIVPESLPYRHADEGPDDMPAHVKSALLGVDLTLPVDGGKLALGTWQGIYLCEFRDRAAARTLIATLSYRAG
jgi:secondary thiamine-phosphate synthase enzyme